MEPLPGDQPWDCVTQDRLAQQSKSNDVTSASDDPPDIRKPLLLDQLVWDNDVYNGQGCDWTYGNSLTRHNHGAAEEFWTIIFPHNLFQVDWLCQGCSPKPANSCQRDIRGALSWRWKLFIIIKQNQNTEFNFVSDPFLKLSLSNISMFYEL